jgi:CheY-like chemotaxis protein
MKVLINVLDDEPIILEWVKKLFPNDYYDLRLFKDAREFINAFSTETDLIITDVKVPGYDLETTLRQFKAISNRVYIIVITGHVDNTDLLPLFPLGVNYVIKKDAVGFAWLDELKHAVEELTPRMQWRATLI